MHPHTHAHTHTYTHSKEAYRALLLKWSKLPGVKKRQQLKTGRQRRGREKEGEASRTVEFAGGTGQVESDTLLIESSAGLGVSLLWDSGTLPAPFLSHALQVVGWVGCMWTLAALGCSLCFCILTCVLLQTFLTGCYRQGEFT